jgi:hypothetical protein
MVTRARWSGFMLVLLTGCSGTSVEEPPGPASVAEAPPAPNASATGGSGSGSGSASDPTPTPPATAGTTATPSDTPTMAELVATAIAAAKAQQPTPTATSPTPSPATEPDTTPLQPNPTNTEPPAIPAAYPGQGFVVHEWGTNTVVSASNGTLQVGLHHEEEDLPGFVYDRLKAVTVADIGTSKVVTKMETPVLYFYSPSPLTVHASVAFPTGVLTQWYPGVSTFLPPIEWTTPTSVPNDAAMGPQLTQERCIDHYQRNGLLDWGAFELLAENPPVEAFPVAPIDAFSWGHARNVASKAVRFPNGETEQFLFYRGLSNVELPATVRASGGGHLSMENHLASPLGATFVVDVRSESGAFSVYSSGVGASATVEVDAPAEGAQMPLAAFTESLAQAVTATLDATGLYHDEAVAMVNTWSHQWFKTPGLRVFYLAPQTWTDAVLPLTLDPLPASLVRVMMVRVEVLTPELEAADASAADRFEADDAGARAYFAALGRFGEPRLRRALELVPSAAGEAFLATLVPEFQRTSGLGE